MRLRLEILPPYDDKIRNALKIFHNHTDDSLAELIFARAGGMDDVEEFKQKMYQEGVRYVRGTQENNYNIFLKNLENPKFELPYLPDAHIVARLFIRMYEIPIVYVQIDIESNYTKEAEDDLGRDDIKAKFIFFIYALESIDPVIEHHDNFPIAILEKYSYYIIAQYPLVVDEKTKVVTYSYPRTFHHKFLVIDYKPPPKEQSKARDDEKNDAADKNVSDSEEEITSETEEIEKCSWKLRPGDII